MHQQAQMNPGLPLPHDSYDPATFNGNLPAQNDKVPQLNWSQFYQQPAAQQMGLFAIASFRALLQSRVQRSALHCFAYNIISQHGFQNQQWTEWCQRVIDFAEFLVVRQQNQGQAAAEKAATQLMSCYYGAVIQAYPVLQQMIGQDLIQPLNQAIGHFQKIQIDLNAYKQGSGMNMNQMAVGIQNHFQQGGGVNVMGQPMNMGGGNQLPPVHQNMAVNSSAQMNVSTNQFQIQQSSAASVGSNYDIEPVHAKALAPTSEWNSGTDYPVADTAQQPKQEPAQMQIHAQAAGIVFHDSGQPVPLSVEDVVLDPNYYVPHGFVVDVARPYDVIYSPGGIESRPAHLVTNQPEWKITRGNDNPYVYLVNPAEGLRVYVKFPDGVVKETVLEWNEMMDYLRHELDADLRAAATRPNGVIKTTAMPISKFGGETLDIIEAKAQLKLNGENAPVFIPVEFEACTHLENEHEARQEVIRVLELEADATIPAHEYLSRHMHFLDVGEDGFIGLRDALGSKCLITCAKTIKFLLETGKLSARSYRFLNERLTNEVNNFMSDSLSMGVKIDSFTDEVGELLDYLLGKYGKEIQQLLINASRDILTRSIDVQETQDSQENVVYSVVDRYLNMQLGWTAEEISDGQLTEKAQLISKVSHPVFVDALKGIFKRHEIKILSERRLRLISADGVYMTVIRGHLIKDALLIKRM